MRLKCPTCANIIDAPAGSVPRCPACGFVGAVTSGTPATFATPAYATAPAGTRPRPGWVLAVAILMFISGGFGILIGMVVAFFGTVAAAFLSAFFGPLGALGGLIVLVGLLIIVFGVLYILLATQVLKGRDWARVLAIVLSAISGAFSLLSLFDSDGGELLYLAFDVLIIVGLCLPDTRAWFAQETAAARVHRVG